MVVGLNTIGVVIENPDFLKSTQAEIRFIRNKFKHNFNIIFRPILSEGGSIIN